MQILVVPLMISLAFVREAVIFTILYAFRFVLMNTTSPVTTSIVNSYIPASKISTISGINSLLNNTIRAVAAMAFGFIVGKSVSGYQSLFIISTVFYGINALVYFFFFRSFRKDPIVKELYR